MHNYLKNLISLFKYTLSLFIKPKNVSVLMYHSVSNNDKRFFTVSEENFEKQMKFLVDKKYNLISTKELLNRLKNKIKFKKRTVFITFDDGFRNNYSIVFPLIKKYKIPIIIFLVTDFIGREEYLNWEEIGEMKNSGLVSFGCHTKSHLDLDKMTFLDVERELGESKIILEENLNQKINFFSYPRGKYNSVILEKVGELKFQMAFTVKEGTVNLKSDRLELSRLSIDSSTSWWQFLGKISGIQFLKNRI